MSAPVAKVPDELTMGRPHLSATAGALEADFGGELRAVDGVEHRYSGRIGIAYAPLGLRPVNRASDRQPGRALGRTEHGAHRRAATNIGATVMMPKYYLHLWDGDLFEEDETESWLG
jgi:hypothetical protein